MINNKTQQTSTVVSGSVTENSMFLKKSELPKNISAFKNDANYISVSALEMWMKKNSYISKNEIEALIKKANISVVDKIDKESDDKAIKAIEDSLVNVKGEIVELKKKLSELYSTVGEVQSGSISINDLKNYAKKEDLSNADKKIEELNSTINKSFATKKWVEDKEYLTEHQSLDGYAKKSDIPSLTGYAKKSDIPSLTGYAKKSDIPSLDDFAKKTDIPSLDGYAKKTDIPSLTGYAKKSDIPLLDNYLTKGELNKSLSNYATKNDISNHLTKSEAKSTYLTQFDAKNLYLLKEDYRGIKSATTINETYKNNTLGEIQDLIDAGMKFIDGFYIIDGYDVIIIKNNDIIGFVNNGEGTGSLAWKEE